MTERLSARPAPRTWFSRPPEGVRDPDREAFARPRPSPPAPAGAASTSSTPIPGGELRNTAGRLAGIAKPLLGLDLRGDGGYVVAPPSRHCSGDPYIWVDPATALAPAPAWLRPPARQDFPITTSVPRTEGTSRYGLAALRREMADMRAAPIGDRNNRLNRAAFSLGMLAAGGEVDLGLVEEELLAAAIDVGLPEGEAKASLHSGLRAGSREPRRRPAT